MNQDINAMAREAGFPLLGPERTKAAERFAALVAAAEREACAKFFDNVSSDGHPEMVSSDHVATAIRARGKTHDL